MINVSQDKFITDYVTTFLATWGAEQFRVQGMAARGLHAPVEQAIFMARAAWYALNERGLISF